MKTKKNILLGVILSVSTFFIAPSSMYGQNKVVGGGITAPSEFPWMVDVVGNTGEHICGGSLIAPGWVLTAGHCGIGMPPTVPAPTKVRINGWRTTSPLVQVEEIVIDQIYIYPGYSLTSATYVPDIALITLVSPSSITPVASEGSCLLPVFIAMFV